MAAAAFNRRNKKQKTDMNKLKFLTLCLVLAVSSFTLQSCNDDDDTGSTYFPNALVTLKTNAETGAFYMQLDDATTLVPTNIKTAPYGGKEVRALVNFKEDQKSTGHNSRWSKTDISPCVSAPSLAATSPTSSTS